MKEMLPFSRARILIGNSSDAAVVARAGRVSVLSADCVVPVTAVVLTTVSVLSIDSAASVVAFCAEGRQAANATRAIRVAMMFCLFIVLYQSIGSYCLVEVKREKEVTLLACLGGRFFILFLS